MARNNVALKRGEEKRTIRTRITRTTRGNTVYYRTIRFVKVERGEKN